ncbi:amidohydrolase family protein [Pseudomonadota bacterium]
MQDSEKDIPICPGPDPDPIRPNFVVPKGAVDTHAHIFGPESKYPYSPARGYTPPDASVASFRHLHQILGIERAVLTQPSVYGTDNRAMLDAVAQSPGNMLAVAAVGEQVTDEELEKLHYSGVRGVRVNLVDKGGMPFSSIDSVREFTERIKPLGWHLEVLIHVHQFPNLIDVMSAMAVDVVVGHLGYMKTSEGIENPGFQNFLKLLKLGKTWVKISGSYRIAVEPKAPYADVIPFAQALIDTAPDRVIWGTDWPHPFFWGNMPNDGVLFNQLPVWAPSNELRYKILVSNPNKLYGFE